MLEGINRILLSESVSINSVNDAIDTHTRIIINYHTKGEDIATGARYVLFNLMGTRLHVFQVGNFSDLIEYLIGNLRNKFSLNLQTIIIRVWVISILMATIL